MKKRLLIPIIITGVLVIILVMVITSGTDCKYAIEEFQKEYNGVIADKYTNRLRTIEIDINGKMKRIVHLTDSIWTFANVGDSISKPSNSNRCTIFKDSSFIMCSFKYIGPECIDRIQQ